VPPPCWYWVLERLLTDTVTMKRHNFLYYVLIPPTRHHRGLQSLIVGRNLLIVGRNHSSWVESWVWHCPSPSFSYDMSRGPRLVVRGERWSLSLFARPSSWVVPLSSKDRYLEQLVYRLFLCTGSSAPCYGRWMSKNLVAIGMPNYMSNRYQ
jgi:hypothetical protein